MYVPCVGDIGARVCVCVYFCVWIFAILFVRHSDFIWGNTSMLIAYVCSFLGLSVENIFSKSSKSSNKSKII
jgi:hypothetical protein